jgi:F0F1-type ATP synthase membrane subunit c/vacuolar-type H+-ATPase subunit K
MKGINFSILSTVPTGPALARDLISSVRPASSGYQQEKIAYLGYLPGGSTGMLDFIHNPRSSMPLMDTGRYAWTYPATQAINSIQDYAGVLIITENSEIGRAWLEQLYAFMPDRPVMMVVSAQSAPLMRPYLDSSQLKGLIGGRVEGAMYDRIMEAPARNPAVNASYQAGMLLAAALIAMGGIFGLLQSVINRRPPAPMEDRHVG